MVEARWSPSITFTMGSGWVQGNYLFKLVSSTGGEAYVPFVLRDDASTSPLVLMQEATTWNAYNKWGGYSLYKGSDGTFANRSRVGSFDRPYGGRGANGMLTSFPYVSLVEKLGLDITYWTDIDLQQRSTLLARHRALISLDHDEYWSREMRDNALAARANGLNIAFLGANAIFRKIRFASSPLGTARRVVNYKIGTEDPLYGVDNPATTPNWRADPVFEPETVLLGAMYECNPVHADMVVARRRQLGVRRHGHRRWRPHPAGCGGRVRLGAPTGADATDDPGPRTLPRHVRRAGGLRRHDVLHDPQQCGRARHR